MRTFVIFFKKEDMTTFVFFSKSLDSNNQQSTGKLFMSGVFKKNDPFHGVTYLINYEVKIGCELVKRRENCILHFKSRVSTD